MTNDERNPNYRNSKEPVESRAARFGFRILSFFRHWTFVIRISVRSFLFCRRSAKGVASSSRRLSRSRQPSRSDGDVYPAGDQMQQPGEQQSDQVEPVETVKKYRATHQQSSGQLGRGGDAPAARPVDLAVRIRGKQ